MTPFLTESAPSGTKSSWRLTGALVALSCASGCTAETAGTARGKAPLQTSDSGVAEGDSDEDDDQDPGDGDGPKGEDDDSGTGCDLTGTYAMQADLNVTWKGTSIVIVPVLDMGTGKLRITTRLTIERKGNSYTGRVRACSTETPDFSSTTVGERYAVRFPDPLWDAAGMPEWELPIAFDCSEPGCAARSETLHALLGVELDDPTGPWPENRRDPRLKYEDHDDDGNPGLTVNALNDGTYTYPPVILGAARATELMLAIRVTSLFDGTIVSCDRLEGDGPGTKVETRAAGCIQDDGNVCGDVDVPPFVTSASTFLDENLPKWEVTKAAWTVVRLEDDADCQDVRDAAF